MRFMFIMLSPEDNYNMDPHEVGRAFSTLMSNQVGQYWKHLQYCYYLPIHMLAVKHKIMSSQLFYIYSYFNDLHNYVL